MNEFNNVESAPATVQDAVPTQPEQAKPKTKRPSRPKAKRKASIKDLPDLSNLASLFECLHWLKDGAHDDWDEAFDKANESGVSIIMEGKEIKGVLLPFEIYNELLGASAKTRIAD